jgi:hypothetical protein
VLNPAAGMRTTSMDQPALFHDQAARLDMPCHVTPFPLTPPPTPRTRKTKSMVTSQPR